MLSSLRVASSYLIRNNKKTTIPNSTKFCVGVSPERSLSSSIVCQFQQQSQQQQQQPRPQKHHLSLLKYFSSDSHDDFAPKRKVVEGEDEALKIIKDHVENNPVMLYMKGNPSMPMCGFSARVVQALKEQEIDFGSVNVLDYPDIREGIKKYSDWPTIPQLYVNGEFIGGCDIVTQMHESGELTELFKETKE